MFFINSFGIVIVLILRRREGEVYQKMTMRITKTEKEEEEDQKRLSRPSCLIVGESTLRSGKKVLKKTKKTKKKILFFIVSLFFLSLDCPFFGCFEDLLALHILKTRKRERERENKSEALLRDIYIYTHI